MELIKGENIHFSFGDKILLQNISLDINKGDKIALVAKNGSGKSTLLKILSGSIEPEGERATLWKSKKAVYGFLSQDEIVLDSEQSIYDALLNHYLSVHAEKMMINNSLPPAQEWEVKNYLEKICYQLNLKELDKKIINLSGGEFKRYCLARVLSGNPDVMILDEPTNHLDIEMVEWLEKKLSLRGITLLMVTHDRYFLDNVCDQIWELDEAILYKYQGNYQEFLVKRSDRISLLGSKFDKLKKYLNREIEWYRRSPKARTTKSKYRMQHVEDLQDKVRQFKESTELKINIKVPRLGSKILELKNVSHSFDDLQIIKNVDYKFKKGEKIGLVGPNGAGKTTLLKLLSGELSPISGRVVIGETVIIEHLTQNNPFYESEKKVIDVIRDIAEFIPSENGHGFSAEQMLEHFLFPRPQQSVRVSELSGGELRRLQLLCSLMKNPNFLLLDEPTNDLDLLTLQVLEEYLIHFPGCLVIISHDRYFLDKVVDHLFIMDGKGSLIDFNQSYHEYRMKTKDTETTDRVGSESKKSWDEEKKIKNKIKLVEKKIDDLEFEKESILSEFNKDLEMNPEKIKKLSTRLEEIRDETANLEQTWEDLV